MLTLTSPWPAADAATYVYTALAILLSLVVVDRLFFNSWRNLPPGPFRLPIVGNALQAPTSHEWLHWAKFQELYGPISSVTMMGQPVILLNDLRVIVDLMEKKSRAYSGRPVLNFAGELIGWNQQMILSPVNDHFHAMRKLVAKHIGTKSSLAPHHHMQENYARLFLARNLEKPSEFLKSIRLFQGASFLRISHGFVVDTTKADPLTAIIEQAAAEFYDATRPGAWLVDIFPIFMKFPEWLPGMSFRKVGEKYRQTNEAQADVPHEWVKKQMAKNEALPSFCAQMLESKSEGFNEEAIKRAANILYGGGTDTVSATIGSFFLAMTMYPGIQKKAQAEVDAVVGSSRLPSFKDRDSLPYVNALMKELLRWHVAGPMGIPHACTEDSEYNGYIIPKGAIVLGNLWKVSQDTKYYSDPESFNPERYLGANPELDPHAWAFGFGKRRCPGIEMADASVYIVIAMVLAVFDISPIKNMQTGLLEIPEHRYVSGTVCYPEPFKCDLKPRSTSSEVLIRSIYDEEQLPCSQL